MHQITQTNTEIGNQGREQGRPPTPSPKSYPFWTPKTNPLRTSLAPACLNHYVFFGCYRIDEQVSNNYSLSDIPYPSSQTKRGQRGLAEASARPRLGGKTYWHRDKARLTGTRNYIILLLESQQGSTPNEFRTLLPCQNFRPQLAQRDGLKAGFESFKAMDNVSR